MKTPISESYWVEPGRLLAGEYPGNGPRTLLRERIGAFLDAGVTTFFDLTEADSGLIPYADIVESEAAKRGIAARHLRFEIPDHTAPSAELTRRILDALDAALAVGEGCYVHCYAGIGRTGSIVGTWLVRHRGISGADAMEVIADLRSHVALADYPSPEMMSQQRLVRSWQPGK